MNNIRGDIARFGRKIKEEADHKMHIVAKPKVINKVIIGVLDMNTNSFRYGIGRVMISEYLKKEVNYMDYM